VRLAPCRGSEKLGHGAKVRANVERVERRRAQRTRRPTPTDSSARPERANAKRETTLDGGRAADAPAEPAARPSALAATRYSQREGHLLLVDDATSQRMGRVRQKGTRPELLVRALLRSLGHRFRLTNRDLDGSPDIANRSRRWAVFVHGCFWHRHGCKATTTPTRNREFWQLKFARNVERDRRAEEALREQGYTVVVVWECETKRAPDLLRDRLMAVLGAPQR
jgi:DNA mismatch endonuclease (patch repair protein)